ncbi:alpha-1,2-glucosyltransferase alg-10 [Zalerion maritima]|uniref:Dol-P-Glc:Glc(2)Man(9)GlcNAc(2)-PP-Dol alpha-1,2-glucosyltransferase n=1 Tax=Zalerion maritima TaxID=339359 RepID=A0AAD5WNS4_9PEZI|nr:alpha-1,2-glucosyltransferase alg-10 [Zalerion maritima]
MGGFIGSAASFLADVARGALILSVAKLVLSLGDSHRLRVLKDRPRQFLVELASPFVVLVLARCWLQVLGSFVPEAYLDEVFHIPQAQTYCEGRYYDWDDKITTPPGLYILTIVLNRILGISSCTPDVLRSFNVYAISLLSLVASECRSLIEGSSSKVQGRGILSMYSMHTALNISLFPILFFFSGLYYTDIASTLAVLACYRTSLGRTHTEGGAPSFLSDVLVLVLGIVALGMRQTNVFWAVVFMGGMEVVHAVKALQPAEAKPLKMRSGRTKDVLLWYLGRYSKGGIHDPPVNLAWPDGAIHSPAIPHKSLLNIGSLDTLISLISLAIAAISNPLRILRQIWPYIAVLLSFAGFVVWNGGVVLGDKSNHVATIHLAQMLYIWPFFLFFSLPLCLSFAFHFAGRMISYISDLQEQKTSTSSQSQSSSSSTSSRKPASHPPRKRGAAFRYTQPKPSSSSPTTTQPLLPLGISIPFLDRVLVNKSYLPYISLLTISCLFLIVKLNTLIHPFTLADNRHYMFYIFRYTIRRNSWLRYALLFPYWTALVNIRRVLAGCQVVYKKQGDECPVSRQKTNGNGLEWLNSPFMDLDMRERNIVTASSQGKDNGKQETPSDRAADTNGHDPSMAFTGPSSPELTPPTTSTEAICLVATALSLITAPLVEPRYFILPWVFWRLHVPAWRMHDCGGSSSSTSTSTSTSTTAATTTASSNNDTSTETASSTSITSWLESEIPSLVSLGQKLDIRLFAETAWFLCINVATIYIFITRPFFWYDAEGNLADEGRMQRFMW